jgi:glyoxylate utilization-related uncharacterized protein
MTRRRCLYRWDALELEKVTEMIARKTIAGEEESLTQAYFKKGALIPVHAHAGEQMIYVLQGALRTLVDGEEITVREGEVLHVPANVAPGRSAGRYVRVGCKSPCKRVKGVSPFSSVNVSCAPSRPGRLCGD